MTTSTAHIWSKYIESFSLALSSVFPFQSTTEKKSKIIIAQSLSSKSSLLILDRHIRAGRTLVLAADKVRNLLVLGLLDGRLVVLWALTEHLFLYEVDACEF